MARGFEAAWVGGASLVVARGSGSGGTVAVSRPNNVVETSVYGNCYQMPARGWEQQYTVISNSCPAGSTWAQELGRK